MDPGGKKPSWEQVPTSWSCPPTSAPKPGKQTVCGGQGWAWAQESVGQGEGTRPPALPTLRAQLTCCLQQPCLTLLCALSLSRVCRTWRHNSVHPSSVWMTITDTGPALSTLCAFLFPLGGSHCHPRRPMRKLRLREPRPQGAKWWSGGFKPGLPFPCRAFPCCPGVPGGGGGQDGARGPLTGTSPCRRSC